MPFLCLLFLFSLGIYSVALSVAQDAELRQLARKYAKEYALLDTLGSAQDNAEIMGSCKTNPPTRRCYGKRNRSRIFNGEMLTARQYMDLIIVETRGKNDDRTVGA